MAFQPYLNFGGNCREAFTQYQKIFGGDLTILGMGDMPAEAGEVPANQKDLVAHAALIVGEDVLMASDAMPDEFKGARDMYVTFATDDASDAERVFNALADGGTVNQPLQPTFFAKAFGVCVDRFGTPWMIVGGSQGPPQ